jgi:hypothetical protein
MAMVPYSGPIGPSIQGIDSRPRLAAVPAGIAAIRRP